MEQHFLQRAEVISVETMPRAVRRWLWQAFWSPSNGPGLLHWPAPTPTQGPPTGTSVSPLPTGPSAAAPAFTCTSVWMSHQILCSVLVSPVGGSHLGVMRLQEPKSLATLIWLNPKTLNRFVDPSMVMGKQLACCFSGGWCRRKKAILSRVTARFCSRFSLTPSASRSTASSVYLPAALKRAGSSCRSN